MKTSGQSTFLKSFIGLTGYSEIRPGMVYSDVAACNVLEMNHYHSCGHYIIFIFCMFWWSHFLGPAEKNVTTCNFLPGEGINECVCQVDMTLQTFKKGQFEQIFFFFKLTNRLWYPCSFIWTAFEMFTSGGLFSQKCGLENCQQQHAFLENMF